MPRLLIFVICWATALLALPADAAAQADASIQAVPLSPGETPRLTGRLDHPAWKRAPVYGQFVEKAPTLDAQPTQATQVQVLFDEQALYVGITAFDTEPALIRKPLVRYDQVNRTQDFVVVYVDPIGSRRSAQWFRVSAAGSQADGLHTAADDNEDFAPDFDWDAAVAPHPLGWTAVLRLPFASLRFTEGGADRWRIMVARRLPRQDFHLFTSVRVPQEAASFIDRLQPLRGVTLPERHSFLTLRPGLTLRGARERSPDGTRRSEQVVDASLDIKWRPLAELVVDATLNPDFSQVALDVPQLSGNTRFALSIPEKRPFFFESADLLRSPTEAFYTRSFTAPRAGLRATWRGSRLAGSTLMVDDRGGGQVLLPRTYGTDVAEQPASRTLAARGRVDEGPLQWGAVMAVRRYEQQRGDNVVFGPDLGWRIDDRWRLRAQWLHARSTALPDGRGVLQRAAAADGDRLYLELKRNGDLRESEVIVQDIGAGFRHDGGFVNQAGVRKLSLFQSQGWQAVGPFHEFWLNIKATRSQARDDGRTVEQQIIPGLYTTAAHNLEWWLELHPVAQLRASHDGPLLPQRYLSSGLVFSPATWFPLLDTSIDIGRLADTHDERLRSGLRWNTTAKLRPLAALELEPSLSSSWLRGDGQRAYDEQIANLLAVWHLGPRSHLRAIVQRSRVEREGLRLDQRQEQSITWSWRPSAGSVFYVGVSRVRDGVRAQQRGTEAFVKLQFDLDDSRRWIDRMSGAGT